MTSPLVRKSAQMCGSLLLYGMMPMNIIVVMRNVSRMMSKRGSMLLSAVMNAWVFVGGGMTEALFRVLAVIKKQAATV